MYLSWRWVTGIYTRTHTQKNNYTAVILQNYEKGYIVLNVVSLSHRDRVVVLFSLEII